jgi:hypothetical protein
MRCRVLAIAAFATLVQAQWTIQDSHTTAGLRGIHSLGAGVAWASGANGTILRTTNDGQTWRTCAIPPSAEKLDFRGIQAFDENTAIIMSSGKGDLSRLYKTIDACRSWKLVFTNPDQEGFWDALQFSRPDFGILIGDQVRGHFPVFSSADGGSTWQKFHKDGIPAVQKNQSIFAASNTALLIDSKNQRFYFITGGGTTTLVALDLHFPVPMAIGESAGGFSLASRRDGSKLIIVAVGGDYKAPDQTIGTASCGVVDHQGNVRWRSAQKTPRGYRSAVAYYAPTKTWIAVGPNGTDFSADDGLNWDPLKPIDAGQNWNTLSLPFVVGPNGRIGKINSFN